MCVRLGALQNHRIPFADSLGPATEVWGWLLPFLGVSGLWVSKGIRSLGSPWCGELRRAENEEQVGVPPSPTLHPFPALAEKYTTQHNNAEFHPHPCPDPTKHTHPNARTPSSTHTLSEPSPRNSRPNTIAPISTHTPSQPSPRNTQPNIIAWSLFCLLTFGKQLS